MTRRSVPEETHVTTFGGIFYGWWLVVLTVLVTAVVATPSFGAIGVWIKALETHFGWSRTQLAVAFSLGHLEGSAAGPIAGFLVDKYGTSRVVFVGLILVSLSFLLFSRTNSLTIFYISFGILMLVTVAGTWLPLMTALNNWFSARRSTAMGIASGGFSLGGFLLTPVIAWMVGPGNLGWSRSALIFGIFFIVIAFPVKKGIRNRPQDYGLLPDGAAIPDFPTSEEELSEKNQDDHALGFVQEVQVSYTVKEAMKTRAFWLIAIGHAFCTMLLGTLSVHLIPMLVDEGYTLQKASYVWSGIMLISGVTQLTFGFIGDKVAKHKAIGYLGILQAIGFVMFVISTDLAVLVLACFIFGIGFGGRVPMANSIRGDYFGYKSYGTISGIMMVPMSLMMLFAPLFAARFFDLQGDYFIPFALLAAFGLIGALMHLPARNPSEPLLM